MSFNDNAQSFKPNEPICVLNIELDGENVEEIRVYEGEDPRIIVQIGRKPVIYICAKRHMWANRIMCGPRYGRSEVRLECCS